MQSCDFLKKVSDFFIENNNKNKQFFDIELLMDLQTNSA